MSELVPKDRAKGRRAMFFHAEEYSQATIRKYDTARRQYECYAHEHGFNSLFPKSGDLADYFTFLSETRSPHFARRAAPALGHYFRSRGAPQLVAHPDVVTAIYGPTAQQDSLDGIMLHRRAQYYADNARSDGTKKNEEVALRHYFGYAAHQNFDPKRPSVRDILTYFSELRQSRSGRTVRDRANVIARYLRLTGGTDLIRHPVIQDLIVGMVRSSPARPYDPLFPEDLRRLLRGLTSRRPLDMRDHAALLCFALGGMTSQLVSALDRSRVTVDGDGVTFYTDFPRRPRIYIGGIDDAYLDIRQSLQSWLDVIGRSPGPLFPRADSRGGFTNQPLGLESFRRVLARLIRASGLKGRFTTHSLRKGFAIRAVRTLGPVRAAELTGYTVSGLQQQAPFFGESYRALAARQSRNRRRWKPLSEARGDTSKRPADQKRLQ